MAEPIQCDNQIRFTYTGGKNVQDNPSCVTPDNIDRKIATIKDDKVQELFVAAKLNAEVSNPQSTKELLNKAVKIAKDNHISYPKELPSQISGLAKKNSPQQGVLEGPSGRDGSAYHPASKDLASITGGR